MTDSIQSSIAQDKSNKRILGIDFTYLLAEWKDIFNKKTVLADVFAGVTVALVALPLNLALAIAAGVEPGVGITTGIVSGLIAGLMGGQRVGVTGPAAAMAVILIGIAQAYGLAAIWLVGLICGMLQFAAGCLRLGKLISFIPLPVIVGFSNAIGVLVIFNSLSDFLGLPKTVAHAGAATAATHKYIPEFVQDIGVIVQRVIMHGEVNVNAVVIGALVLTLALLVPKWTKLIPGQLVAIVVASLVAAQLGFKIPRIIDISSIPTIIPIPKMPELPWSDFEVLFPSAIACFMLGSIESLLSASVADGMTMSKRHHSDQELVGQGIANMAMPFFGGIPVTGVIARTAVNIRAGAKTRLATIVHSLALLFLAFSLARYAEQIPLAALSGVLILTGIRLIEWDVTRQIWLASKAEGWVVVVTTIISVLIDLTAGVFAGLLMTCGLFIKQMAAVKMVSEQGQTDKRSFVRQPIPSCKFVRTFLIDGPLFFGAAERFTETILQTHNLKVVILHMKAVSAMDLTGAETILSIHAQLSRNGIRLCLAELPRASHELLKRLRAPDKIGKENFFKDYKECLLDVNSKLLKESSSCSDCCSLLTAAPGSKVSAPSDCALATGIVFNTNQVSSILKERLSGEVKQVSSTNEEQFDTSPLITISTENDIPSILQDTPVSALLKSQNFFQVDETPSDFADLIIGMCIDYRKQLHLPKNCAYVIRSAGANMKDAEFSVALGVSSGIEYMALITHNKCLMSDPFSRREAVLETLSKDCAWSQESASVYFDEQATDRGISDPIEFALSEAQRIHELYPKLKVVPILYCVDDDKLYLIKEWLNAETAKQSKAATA